MKKYALIYNPVSGDARFKSRLDEVVEYLQAAGSLVLPFRTRYKGDIRPFINEIKGFATDGFIVAGGDGTMHEVINAMLAEDIDVPLGIIPSGTCNDFATHLNFGKDLPGCLRAVTGGLWRAVDVGSVNGEYFLNVASAGLLTSVAHSVDASLKNTLGRMAYYFKGLGELPSFRSLHVRITADGQVFEDDILLFLIMNSGMVGSFPTLAPAAKVDDGKLDLLIVNKCSIPDLMGLFISIFSGRHTSSSHIRYVQATDIVIECDEPVESDLDGERGPLLPLAISTVTNKLKVFRF
ncbi:MULTISPECIES: diacylglycerol kinase family protein [Sporomusa]|jgi:diacylglycerol kinase (ATP)|uniref:Diacylglycerol kinase n=1 Tax=Sporomusa sphaeroides DSM 2875 TaxID=1337886 RepID=A0ABM9W438_9FIRM|nr:MULTISPECIES: YegS/Rv2252/BmrU family lipid kinase [Sporomusa]MCM0761461.1 YegS/Rv2252/BmrU family lipid kinase [Sporomusa sphaeroides DSM 2875]OLS56536.1 diacylglycerol kinase [Sporomusa sphaeroides DSM 2875]CVK19096.1 Diacylglycerol kinase [Sporomusa sphaeroides DSM 2875]HML32527.1 YegS/Rv2252/BmrU family lipid kinase [Sporomusa sphaeroides]